MNSDELREAIHSLSLGELQEHAGEVRRLIRRLKASEGRKPQAVETVEERVVGKKTFRRQYIRCGRDSCRCRNGRGHGPYWYCFWTENGRTRSRYIGKKING